MNQTLDNSIIGDEVYLTEICPGAGVSSQGTGKIVEVFDSKPDKAFMVEKDGEYRLLIKQEKWGYAYNYFSKYKKTEKGWQEI